MVLDSSLKVCFVMLENFCTFVTYYILEGRETCQSLTGIFYACTLHIRRFRTSCWSVNILTAFYNFSEYSDGIKDSINLLPGG